MLLTSQNHLNRLDVGVVILISREILFLIIWKGSHKNIQVSYPPSLFEPHLYAAT